MVHFFGVIILLLIVIGVGSLALPVSIKLDANPLGKLVLAAALGMGIVGYSVFLMGIAGWIYAPVYLPVFAVGAVVFAKPAIHLTGASIKILFRDAKDPQLTKGLMVFLWGICGIILGVTVLKALLPPIGSDPLAYHLELPKRFIENNRILYFPDMATSVFPLFMHMFFLIGLLLQNPSAPQFFQWGCGVFSAIAIYALAKEWMGKSYALLAGVIFLAVPGVFHQMPAAQNDIGVLFFQFLQLYCIWQWIAQKKIAWAVLGGIFAGLSLSVKLIAIAGCVSGFLVLVLFFDRSCWRANVAAIAAFSLAAFLTCFCWYLRAYLYTGNPVYPYFPEFFGGAGRVYSLTKHGMGKGLIDFFLAPFRMTFIPGNFGGQGNQYGPLFLFVLPWLFFLKKDGLQRPVRFLTAYAVIYFILWFKGAQNLRFFFPVLPALSILTAMVFYFIRSAKQWIKVVLWSILILCLSGQSLLALAYLRTDWKYLIGQEKAPQYLSRLEKSYAIADYINKNLGKDVKILSMEVRVFYFQRPVIHYGRNFKRYQKTSTLSSRQMPDFLKGQGFTHLLLTRQSLIRDPAGDPLFELLQDEMARTEYFNTVFEMKTAGSEQNKVPPYMLLEIR